MIQQPKVSMVITCYNKELYIGEMLQSVCNQKWESIEVILVNDGSTDGTRDIIAEWEPKLKSRGYDVVIIDQENQGVSYALRNGMLAMSGDYFCAPDCDDLITPEYVSTMAGWLMEHPDYEWVMCGTGKFAEGDIASKGLTQEDSVIYDKAATCSQGLERLYHCLFGNVSGIPKLYMIRTQYLKKGRVLELYHADKISVQAEQFYIPLCAQNGRIHYFDAMLYWWRQDSRDRSQRNPEEFIDFCYHTLNVRTKLISQLDYPADLQSRLISASKLAAEKGICIQLPRYPQLNENIIEILAPHVEKSVTLVNKLFHPSPNLSVAQVLNLGVYGPRVLFRAIENNLIGRHTNCFNPTLFKTSTPQIIGYGVLGKIGSHLWPLFQNTTLAPTMLWDKKAKPDLSIDNLAITKPDFTSISPNDIILIFPTNYNAVEEIDSALENVSLAGKLNYFDILDYLSLQYFPQFYEECTFVGE